MAKIRLSIQFLRIWFFGIILSTLALFFAYLIGGGGEYPSGNMRDIFLALIHHPLPYASFAILMGMLIGIGMTNRP
jgi:hypothetical protein